MKINQNTLYGKATNDADYKTRWKIKYITDEGKIKTKEVRCPYYTAWTNMLRRALSEHEKKINPTYKDVTVCEEWLLFSNFKNWMEKQVWEGLCLDKDILVEYNKEYSPSTCAFVPDYVNKILLDRKNNRGNYPLGVIYAIKSKGMINERAKPYCAQITSAVIPKHNLGYFHTPEEAHKAWQEAKAKSLELTVQKWHSEHPESFRTDVAESLIARAWNLRLDKVLSKETMSLC